MARLTDMNYELQVLNHYVIVNNTHTYVYTYIHPVGDILLNSEKSMRTGLTSTTLWHYK